MESQYSNKISAEHLLYDTLKWTFWNVKVLGYNILSPEQLTPTTKGGLSLIIQPWWGLSRLYPNLLIFLTIVANIIIFSESYYRSLHTSYTLAPTETLILTVAGLVCAYAAVILKLSANINSNSNLRFWQRTVELLDYISGCNDEVELFHKLKCKLRKRVLICYAFFIITPYILYFSLSIYFKLPYYGTSGQKIPSIYFNLSALFWSFLSNGHLVALTWIVCFIQIYNICLSLVKKRLTKLISDTQHGNKTSRESPPAVVNVNGMHNLNIFQVSELKDRQNVISMTRDSAETQILNCIKIYYRIESEVHAFDKFFGNRIIFEILLLSTYITMYLFIFLLLSASASLEALIRAISAFSPLILSLIAMYDFGSSGSKLTKKAYGVLGILQKSSTMENIDLSLTTRLQMHTLMTHIKIAPPEPNPGSYFKLNRSMITCLGSAIITYLVIFIQFRNADDDDVNKK